MEFVEPIREREKIELIKKHLRKQSERNYMLFKIGVNTGLRIGDLLNLRVRDLKGQKYVRLRTQKRNKPVKVPLEKELQREIRNYIKGKEDHEYLFCSRKGVNQPITRQTAYMILNKAARSKGVRLKNIGCHSMRKTFGYWHYQTHKDITLLQEIFNHTDPDYTRRYIGISQDDIDRSMEGFCL